MCVCVVAEILGLMVFFSLLLSFGERLGTITYLLLVLGSGFKSWVRLINPAVQVLGTRQSCCFSPYTRIHGHK